MLLARPSLLIIDESSLLCSDMEPEKLFHVLRQLNAQNTAVIYITHNIREAIEISDRIFILKNGVSVGIYERGAYTADQIVAGVAGQETAAAPQTRIPSDEIVLRASHLSGSILRDVSFHVRRGESFGITGLLDAGKTELLKYPERNENKIPGSNLCRRAGGFLFRPV